MQNLHGFFPQLLNNIFGYSSSTDWGLKTLSRDSRDFAAVKKFLSPSGALFKLIDKLQADDQHRYEFFISCLPVSLVYLHLLLFYVSRIFLCKILSFIIFNPGRIATLVEILHRFLQNFVGFGKIVQDPLLSYPES